MMALQISKKRTLIICIPLLLLIVLLLFVPYQTALVFYKEDTHHIEAYLPVEAGDRLQMIYKHSIHLTDVVEKYTVLDNQTIKQYETVFEHYGIGMPENAQGDEEFVYEDGKYHIKNMDRTFDSIDYRNGKTVSENRIIWGQNGEHFVWFNDYFEPGESLTIKIKKRSLWEYWRGVEIHEQKTRADR